VSLVYAAILYWSSRRTPIARAAILVPVILNAALAIGSDIILLADRPALSTGGTWAVVGFGAGAALLAVAQFIAGRRLW
jgi:hypothetical protein